MIKTAFRRVPKPGFYETRAFHDFTRELRTFHLEGGSRTLQRQFPHQAKMAAFVNQALPSLHKLFDGKCAYTEVPLAWRREDSASTGAKQRRSTKGGSEDLPPELGELGLHRPAADAIGLDSQFSPEHYWWLVPVWTNWYLVHPRLNATKGNQFPVAGERFKAKKAQEFKPIDHESGLLLDPRRDEPAWYLDFQPDGSLEARQHPSERVQSLFGGHSRGEITLRLLDLNAPWIHQPRQQAGWQIRSEIELLPVTCSVSLLKKLTLRAEPFAGLRRQLLARWLIGQGQRGSHELSDSLFSRAVSFLLPEIAAGLLHNPIPLPSTARAAFEQVSDFAVKKFPDLKNSAAYRKTFDKWPTTVGPPATRGTPTLGLDHDPGLDDAKGFSLSVPAVEKSLPAPANAPQVYLTASITKVEIENFKAIQRIELDFTSTQLVELPARYGYPDDPPELRARGWKALLGENGSGKSCILQAIGLALAGNRLEELCETCQIDWSHLLRRPAKEAPRVSQGSIKLSFTGDIEIELNFHADGYRWKDGLAPITELFVRGYGATRLLDSPRPQAADSSDPTTQEEQRQQRHRDLRQLVRVDNLFDPRRAVVDAQSWLLSLLDPEEVGDFHAIATTLKELLAGNQLPGQNSGDTPGPTLEADHQAGEVLVDGIPLNQVSDGYRAVISIVCDILAGLGQGLSDLHNARGIVLIDELGAHLHPSWRMNIVEKLRRALPNVQFIISTHEPLCLRGLYENEVVRVRKLAEEGVVPETLERSPSDFRVDQLLTSEFFGLDTTIDPDLDRRFQTYYRLLAIDPEEITAEQKVERDQLDSYLQHHCRPALGNTRRDQLVYEAIDKFLAVEGNLTLEQRQTQRTAALGKIVEIWDRRRGGQL